MIAHTEREAEILLLGVDPAHRRRGVGGALLRACTRAWQAEGVQQAHLEVRRDNTAALALYMRAGFDAVGVRPRYYRAADGGVDAICMRWQPS